MLYNVALLDIATLLKKQWPKNFSYCKVVPFYTNCRDHDDIMRLVDL